MRHSLTIDPAIDSIPFTSQFKLYTLFLSHTTHTPTMEINPVYDDYDPALLICFSLISNFEAKMADFPLARPSQLFLVNSQHRYTDI
jgi:hypothetical protein